MPHAKRIGLTRKQLAEDCDGCLKRALAPVTRRVAENMVYRADWLGSKELDDDTLEVGGFSGVPWWLLLTRCRVLRARCSVALSLSHAWGRTPH